MKTKHERENEKRRKKREEKKNHDDLNQFSDIHVFTYTLCR